MDADLKRDAAKMVLLAVAILLLITSMIGLVDNSIIAAHNSRRIDRLEERSDRAFLARKLGDVLGDPNRHPEPQGERDEE